MNIGAVESNMLDWPAGFAGSHQWPLDRKGDPGALDSRCHGATMSHLASIHRSSSRP
jgi:hypothetical protein